MFSGTVKIADIDDFISPSQNCVKPMMTPSEYPAGSIAKTQIMFSDDITLPFKSTIKPDLIKTSTTNTAKVSLNDCLACSGCVTSAETILIQQQSADEFYKNLEDKQKKVVISFAPQSVASLAKFFEIDELSAFKKFTSFFKNLGVLHVFEMRLPTEIALLEAKAEFVAKFKKTSKYKSALEILKKKLDHKENQMSMELVDNKEDLPLTEIGFSDKVTQKTASHKKPSIEKGKKDLLPVLTSECPGWVCYSEKVVGKSAIPYMSTCKSPQQIAGTLVKNMLADRLSIDKRDVYHVCVMPCYDKKLEASRTDFVSEDGIKEVDTVLATLEIIQILEREGVNFLDVEPSHECDILKNMLFKYEPTQEDKNRLIIHNFEGNACNGYLEYVFRESAKELFNVNVEGSLDYKTVKNIDFREVTLEVEGIELMKFAAAYGFRNIQNLVRSLKRNTSPYDYVEIMACPGGCINGGGQMRPKDKSQNPRQLLMEIEQKFNDLSIKRVEKPQENPRILEFYSKILQDAPYGPVSRSIFHTSFHEIEKQTTAFNIKW